MNEFNPPNGETHGAQCLHGPDLHSSCDDMGDHDYPIGPIASTALILLIVAVLFTVFLLTSHQFDGSVRFADPDSHHALDQPATGGFKRRAAILSLGAFSAILFFRSRRSLLWRPNFTTWSILAYVCFAAISVLWADDSALVFRRVVSFLILSFSAFTISLTVPLRKLPIVLLLTTLMFLAVGVFSEIYFGTFLHSMTGLYRFSGTCHPESQAMNCSMIIIASMAVNKTTKKFGLILCCFIVFIGFIFLILTRSRGPFVATIISIIAFRFYTSKNRSNVSFIYGFFLILLLFFLVFGEMSLEFLGNFVLMGRSGHETYDLNGRIPLWNECLEFVLERPLFGHGFQGFWTQNRIEDISRSQGWFLNHSHSNYLETALNLGFLGLFLFLSMIISGWNTALRTYYICQHPELIFCLSFIILVFVDGMITSSIGGLNFLIFFLFIVLFSIARKSSEIESM